MRRPLVLLGLGEFVGTFVVVFVAAGSVVTVAGALGGVDGGGLAAVALAYGLVYGTALASSGRSVAGGLNPAVAVGRFVAGRLSLSEVSVALAAQIASGAAGAGLLRVALPESFWEPVQLGALGVNQSVSTGQAVLIEAVVTLVLVWAVTGVVAHRVPSPTTGPSAAAGIVGGAVVVAGVLVAGPFTGGALNPARAFGPAIAQWSFSDVWVYWVGPLAGGVVGAVLADLVTAAPPDVEGIRAEEFGAGAGGP